jgi:hypothetical protein
MSHPGNNAIGGVFRVPLSVETAAFDLLGPRGLAALNRARFAFSAESVRQVLAGLEVSLSYEQMDDVAEKTILAEDAVLLAAIAAKARLPVRTLDASKPPFTVASRKAAVPVPCSLMRSDAYRDHPGPSKPGADRDVRTWRSHETEMSMRKIVLTVLAPAAIVAALPRKSEAPYNYRGAPNLPMAAASSVAPSQLLASASARSVASVGLACAIPLAPSICRHLNCGGCRRADIPPTADYIGMRVRLLLSDAGC